MKNIELNPGSKFTQVGIIQPTRVYEHTRPNLLPGDLGRQ